MDGVARLRVKISRLLELATDARTKGHTDRADQLVHQAMRHSEDVTALERAPTLNPRPVFKPRGIDTGEKQLWYVEAEWADGRLEEIGQFASITEAWNWIATQSRDWFNARSR
jgi:hypothetical protein